MQRFPEDYFGQRSKVLQNDWADFVSLVRVTPLKEPSTTAILANIFRFGPLYMLYTLSKQLVDEAYYFQRINHREVFTPDDMDSTVPLSARAYAIYLTEDKKNILAVVR